MFNCLSSFFGVAKISGTVLKTVMVCHGVIKYCWGWGNNLGGSVNRLGISSGEYRINLYGCSQLYH